jgi:multisubunit Na+/H+ antiporter MnhC subunit
MISLEFLLASGIGLLTATGIYLILRARTFPVVLGLAMIGYAERINDSGSFQEPPLTLFFFKR